MVICGMGGAGPMYALISPVVCRRSGSGTSLMGMASHLYQKAYQAQQAQVQVVQEAEAEVQRIKSRMQPAPQQDMGDLLRQIDEMQATIALASAQSQPSSVTLMNKRKADGAEGAVADVLPCQGGPPPLQVSSPRLQVLACVAFAEG